MGKMRKKGIFFTMIAISLLALFLVIFTPGASVFLQTESQASKIRVRTIDNYVALLKTHYFETVLTSTSYKAALSLVLYENKTRAVISSSDLNRFFYEVMTNGTIGGAQIDEITEKKIMENNTLLNWSKKISDKGYEMIQVNTTIRILNVTVEQTTPWHIDVIAFINFSVKSEIAQWGLAASVKSSAGIENLPDPYYLMNTNGDYTNDIRQSSVQFDKWNLSHTREHLRNGTYVHWENSSAPSFLMKLTGDTANSSCCGIESLVNPNNLLPEEDQRESYVDYLFWSHTFNNPTECVSLLNITNPPMSEGLWDEFQYFKLDIESAKRYNVTDYSIVNCG